MPLDGLAPPLGNPGSATAKEIELTFRLMIFWPNLFSRITVSIQFISEKWNINCTHYIKSIFFQFSYLSNTDSQNGLASQLLKV